MEQAQNITGEDDDENDSSSARDGDSDSESKSSFGIDGSSDDNEKKGGKQKKAAAAARKLRKIEKPEEDKAAAASRKSQTQAESTSTAVKGDKLQPKPKESLSKAAKAKQEKATKLLTAAQKCQAALEEVSADMIWRSVIRGGEVDRRLQKSGQAEADLQAVVNDGAFQGNDEVVKLLEKMPPYRDNISKMRDLCKQVRSCTSTLASEVARKSQEGSELRELFSAAFECLLNDRDSATLIDIISSLARKLLDVTLALIGAG